MTTAAKKKKWSQKVTEHSDAMDLEEGVFKSSNPREIAHSLKQYAEVSHSRKSTPSARPCRC